MTDELLAPLPKKVLGKRMAMAGLALSLSPLIFIGIAFLVGFLSFFANQSSEPVPEQMAGLLSTSIALLITGTLLGIIGIMLTTAALFALRYRGPWFFNMGIVVSFLWILLGFVSIYAMVPGLYLFIAFFFKRNEFYQCGQDATL